jgi:type IV pilus assembly protein PilC
MEKYNYLASNKKGEKVKGLIEAVNQVQAISILRSKGFFVIKLERIEVLPPWMLWLKSLQKVKSAHVVHFTRQLATMINAGLPLNDALSILKYQSSLAMAKIIDDVLRDIEGGASFHQALSRFPDVFNPVYLSLIRSGEAAGVLEKILVRLADNLEKEQDFKSKTKNALIYPMIVTFAMVTVAVVMVIFVIPKLTSLYAEFGATLPLFTRILIGISNFAVRSWYIVAVILGGGSYGLWRWKQTKTGQEMIDKYVLKVPIFGKLRSRMILTEITRTLSLLAEAGIPVIEALEIVAGAADNVTFANSIKTAAKEVEKGVPLAAAIGKYEHFPPIVPQMIAVGEETGKVDEVLMNVSRYFESESEQAVKALTTAIEPLMMILLGVGVAFLVIAIVMPIYNLTSQF